MTQPTEAFNQGPNSGGSTLPCRDHGAIAGSSYKVTIRRPCADHSRSQFMVFVSSELEEFDELDEFEEL